MTSYHIMCRLVVVLQNKTFIYDLNSTTILEEIETVPNTKGKVHTAGVCQILQVTPQAGVIK
jgi:hypothetical protein